LNTSSLDFLHLSSNTCRESSKSKSKGESNATVLRRFKKYNYYMRKERFCWNI